MKKKKKTTLLDDYIKASRKGSREAELEVSVGWVAKTKPHKNLKKYNRKREKQHWKNEHPTVAFLFFSI